MTFYNKNKRINLFLEHEMSSAEKSFNNEITETRWTQDGVRAWFVFAASFYLYAIVWGTPGALPMLLPYLIKLYNQTSDPRQMFYKNSYSYNSVFFLKQESSPTANGILYRSSKVQALPLPLIVTRAAVTPISPPPSAPHGDVDIHSKVQLIWSLNNAAIYFVCVLVPLLYNRVGCRLAMLLGVALFVVGALLPALFPGESLWIWWLAFGVVNGAGSAIMYVTSCLVLEQSFKRHFGLASGLVTLGSAVSFTLFPLLWQRLLDSGPAFARAAPGSPEAIAAGLSLSLFSVVLAATALIPMLPLFGSPFFMAQRTAQLLFRTRRLHCRAPSSVSCVADSVNDDGTNALNGGEGESENSTSQLSPLLSGSRSRGSSSGASSSSLNSTCASDSPPPGTTSTSTSVSDALYFLCDIPVTSGCKCSRSSDTTPSANIAPASDSRAKANVSAQLGVYWGLVLHRNFFISLLSGQLFQFVTCVPDSFSVMQASDEKLFPNPTASPGLTLTFYGVSQSIGKLVVSPLSDVFRSLFGRTMLSTGGVVVKGLATGFAPVALLLVPRLETIFALNAVYGFWDGLQYGVYSAFTLSLLGSVRYADGIALSQFLCAIPTLFGAPLAGFLYDRFKDYCTSRSRVPTDLLSLLIHPPVQVSN